MTTDAGRLGIATRQRQSRPGTSIHDFLKHFQDDDSCLEHVFAAVGGREKPCPQCGRAARWYHVRKTRRYVVGCCNNRSYSPLANTVFARSNVPLRKWFRALLYLTNADAGLPTAFLAAQLGVSSKAAWRMATRLRQHLQYLDWSDPLGGDHSPVFLTETVLRSIVQKGAAPNVKVRVLVLGDGSRVRFLPLRQGRFRDVRAQIEHAVAPTARIVIRSPETAAKVHDRRQARGARYDIAEDPWARPFGELEAAVLRMKRFVLHAHLRIDATYLPGYLGHFSYLWNQRNLSESAFDRAIRVFPSPSGPARAVPALPAFGAAGAA